MTKNPLANGRKVDVRTWMSQECCCPSPLPRPPPPILEGLRVHLHFIWGWCWVERNFWHSSWVNFSRGERRRKEVCWLGEGEGLFSVLNYSHMSFSLICRTITLNERRKCRSSAVPGGDAMAQPHPGCLLPGTGLWSAKQSAQTPSERLPGLHWETATPLGLLHRAKRA